MEQWKKDENKNFLSRDRRATSTKNPKKNSPHLSILNRHLGPPARGHDLLLDVGRDDLVLLQLHRVLSTAFGHAPQRGNVLEHLRQGHAGLDQLDAGRLVDELGHEAAARVEVPDDVAHVVLGRGHLDLHDGLEQASATFAHPLAEGLAGSDLEREHGRVDVVVATVVERGGDVDDGEAGEDARGLARGVKSGVRWRRKKKGELFLVSSMKKKVFSFLSFSFFLSLSLLLSLPPKPHQPNSYHHLLQALGHSRDVLLGHHSTLDVRLENEAGPGLSGLELDCDVGELAGAARLLLVDVADVGELGDGLAVVDLVLVLVLVVLVVVLGEEEEEEEKVSFRVFFLFPHRRRPLLLSFPPSLPLPLFSPLPFLFLSPAAPRRRIPP